MGSTEQYIIILCFVITIWSNTVNADIDCRRFVFAPSCRGVSAKRSQMRSHNSQEREADFLDESAVIPSEDSDSENQIQKRYQKRFTDLLKTSLLRRNPTKDLRRYKSLLRSLEDYLGSNESDD